MGADVLGSVLHVFTETQALSSGKVLAPGNCLVSEVTYMD